MSKSKTIVDDILKQVKKEKKIHLFEDDQLAVGSYLRKKRIDKNLTQQEVSGDSCSHSYLSKIESNKIKPNMECVLKLFSKLQIDENTMYLIENNGDMLKESYESYFYQDKDTYQKLYNKVKMIKDNQFADTIKLGYYLLNDNINKASNIVYGYKLILGSLTASNLYIFALYCGIALYKMRSYKDSYLLINELLSKDVDDKLTLMAKETCFNLCVELDKPSLAFILYSELLDRYSKLNFIDKLDSLKMGYFELLFRNKEYSFLLSESKNIKLNNLDKYLNKYNYIIGLALFNKEKYNESRSYLTKIEKSSIYYSLCIFEREALYLGDLDRFYKETEEEFIQNPTFYYTYYLKFKNMELDNKTFSGQSYLDAYSRGNIYLKKKLLDFELKYYESLFKYKETVRVHKKMEELTSID